MKAVRWILGGDRRRKDTLVECRHCGTTLSADSIRCTECESSEIASYAIQ